MAAAQAQAQAQAQAEAPSWEWPEDERDRSHARKPARAAESAAAGGARDPMPEPLGRHLLRALATDDDPGVCEVEWVNHDFEPHGGWRGWLLEH